MTKTNSIRDLVECSPDKVSGVPVFRGTRVPVRTLIDHLEVGDSLDVFLEDFPSVTRQQAVAFLELAKDAALADFHESAA
jgi:uncharacterized protein (DUF433 family)